VPGVLIVDDDAALLDALAETVRLRMPGVSVETMTSAVDALARVSTRHYDAVVADIKMPGIDGLQLLSKLRQLRPQTPVLLMTAHGEQEMAVQALREGAHDYIAKPIDREYFINALKRAFE